MTGFGEKCGVREVFVLAGVLATSSLLGYWTLGHEGRPRHGKTETTPTEIKDRFRRTLGASGSWSEIAWLDLHGTRGTVLALYRGKYLCRVEFGPTPRAYSMWFFLLPDKYNHVAEFKSFPPEEKPANKHDPLAEAGKEMEAALHACHDL